MNLGFKDRFIPLIESGAKRHTIRTGKRWRAGMLAHLYKNMRGAKAGPRPQTLLFIAPVVKVEEIRMTFNAAIFRVYVEREQLDKSEMDALACRDGFPGGTGEMWRFWMDTHGPGIFEGQVIHWDFEKRQCCQRDTDGDGNCPVHSAPGKPRHA